MYEITRLDDRSWSLTANKSRQFVGSLKDVCKVAIGLGFSFEEIEIAIDEMAWMNHDAAHFGIFKGFIYSYDTKEKKV
jgi:hypothetical protein